MAKSFSSLSKGLGLTDFFTFGKYKDCRVDSILDQDPAYISYVRANFGTFFQKEVLDLVPSKIDGVNKMRELDRQMTARNLRKHGIAALFSSHPNEEWDDPLTWDDVPF